MDLLLIVTASTTQQLIKEKLMTEAQKLQIEINEMNAKLKANIEENTVNTDDFPNTRKAYTYKHGNRI